VPGIEQARAHVPAKQGLAGPRLDTVCPRNAFLSPISLMNT
jgi:hypothetical protein